jgi:hypothetical protein
MRLTRHLAPYPRQAVRRYRVHGTTVTPVDAALRDVGARQVDVPPGTSVPAATPDLAGVVVGSTGPPVGSRRGRAAGRGRGRRRRAAPYDGSVVLDTGEGQHGSRADRRRRISTV